MPSRHWSEANRPPRPRTRPTASDYDYWVIEGLQLTATDSRSPSRHRRHLATPITFVARAAWRVTMSTSFPRTGAAGRGTGQSPTATAKCSGDERGLLGPGIAWISETDEPRRDLDEPLNLQGRQQPSQRADPTSPAGQLAAAEATRKLKRPGSRTTRPGRSRGDFTPLASRSPGRHGRGASRHRRLPVHQTCSPNAGGTRIIPQEAGRVDRGGQGPRHRLHGRRKRKRREETDDTF